MKYLLIVLLLAGCTSYNRVGDGPETWVSEKTGANETLYYCRTDKMGEPAKVVPYCLPAKFQGNR